jgi:hypothetical protein
MRSSLRYLFFGWVDGWQSEQIEQLRDWSLQNELETAKDLETLRRRTAEQTQQIEELTTIVGVLSRMLAEAGHVDPSVLHHRVDAALEERRAPAPPPPVQCMLCGKQRPANEISSTAYGPVCSPSCDAKP